jgi:fatty acid desaturase/predicted heme/steroid binding protein
MESPSNPRGHATVEERSKAKPAAPRSLPVFTYAEVAKHDSEASAFVVHDGLVYDVTQFLQFHPGGKSILLTNLGTDITDMVASFHDPYVAQLLSSEGQREQYGIRLVAKLAPVGAGSNQIGLQSYQSRRQYSKPDPMAAELRKRVYAYLRENGLPIQKCFLNSLFLILFFYFLYAIGVWMAFIRGSAVWCLLLGPICTFGAVNVAHSVMHGAFADSRTLKFFGRTLWDLGGYSSRSWDIEHQIHHQAPHTVIDLQTAGDSLVRFFEHQTVKSVHRYQMFYIWFAFVLFSPSSWLIHTYKTLFLYKCVPLSEKAVHVAAKMVGFLIPISVSFYRFGAGTALVNLFLFAVSMSYSSLFLLFIQHEDCYLPQDGTEAWSVRQVATSSTWYTRNRALEWLLGYFNYHTEHHLFPGLNPALYPKIQPIVQSVCREFGIRYKYISFFELVRSQIQAWKKFAGEAEALTRAGFAQLPKETF